MDGDLLRLRVEMVRGLVAGLLLAVVAMVLVFALDEVPSAHRDSPPDGAPRAVHSRPPR